MTFTFGDYDQSLNKLGQLLVLLKFGNPKAADDATKLRSLGKQIFASECSGLCYFREVNFLPSNFGDLQLHRSPFGFILYSKCCSGEDLKAAVIEFDRAKMLYGEPPCLCRHIINVSEANCDFEALLDCRFTEETVLITKDFDKTVSFALKTFVADIVSVVKSLLNERKTMSTEDAGLLDRTLRIFQLDEKVDSKKQRKLLIGKWYKHLGDLSFVCGALCDAEQYFLRAVEFLKSSSDPWLAAAKESLVAVSLMNTLKSSQLPDVTVLGDPLISGKQWTIWLAWFEDATNVYANFRQCYSLFLESLLRLAHLQLLGNQKCNAARTLSSFSGFEIVSVPGIGRNYMESDRASRYLKVAKTFEAFDWHRKAAFYYRMAAMQSVTDAAQSSEWVTCHHLLMKAVRGYGLACLSSSNSPPLAVPTGFVQLQSRLLMDLYTSSQAFGNYPLALRHACQALDTGGQTLFSYQLSQIFNDMCKLAPHSNTLTSPLAVDSELVLLPLSSSPYPRLLAISFHPETVFRSSTVIRPTSSANLPGSPSKMSFIYSPFSHPEKPTSEPICVCLEEEIKLVLEFENPFVLPLKIDSLSLLTSHKNPDVECISITEEVLFPSSPKSIVLTCRSRLPGSLFFTGCSVTVYGVNRKIIFADILSASSRSFPSQSCFEVEVLPVKLPFLFIKPNNSDGDIDVIAFLGEESNTYLTVENSVSDVKPVFVDLTLKGVPPSVEKALTVTFQSDSILNVTVDGTQLPCRFSSAFDVTSKFVYSAMGSDSEYFRSLTFNFRTFISAAVHATVVGIERRNRQELVLDVKFEHTASSFYRNNPIKILLGETARSDEPEGNFVFSASGKRHLRCLIDNERLASLIPGLGVSEMAPCVECFDLQRILKFNWEILSEDPPHNEVIRYGQCSAIVCGSELIGQLRVPPFFASVSWWKTEAGKLSSSKYEDYGKPVNVNLADPITFCIAVTAATKLPDAFIRLNLESLSVQQGGRLQRHDSVSTSPPYLISGLSCTPSKCLGEGDNLEHAFCLIACATGRHRVSCDIVTGNGVWPLCPAIYLSCAD